jgi:hypothetical protein
MPPDRGLSEPTAAQLLAVISTQIETQPGDLGLGGVMAMVTQQAQVTPTTPTSRMPWWKSLTRRCLS